MVSIRPAAARQAAADYAEAVGSPAEALAGLLAPHGDSGAELDRLLSAEAAAVAEPVRAACEARTARAAWVVAAVDGYVAAVSELDGQGAATISRAAAHVDPR